MSFRLLFALAAAASIARPAMAANQIVVRSSGPSAKVYPVGKQLAAGTQLNLRPGDKLTVLGPMDRAATADALLKRGCQAQLDLLVERALWDNP